MPKTRTVEILGQKFVIKDFPLQLIDWIQRQSFKIKKAGEIDENNMAEGTIEMEHELLKRFVVDPKIDDDYLENEAGKAEYKLYQQIMKEFRDLNKDILDDLKKKPTD
jgi:hypothetical protein